MEIECRKHSRINIRARKRCSRAVGSKLTDTERAEALGPNANVSKRPLNQPLSPTIIENTGLTQEMRILEISNIPIAPLTEDTITPPNGSACSKLCQDDKELHRHCPRSNQERNGSPRKLGNTEIGSMRHKKKSAIQGTDKDNAQWTRFYGT